MNPDLAGLNCDDAGAEALVDWSCFLRGLKPPPPSVVQTRVPRQFEPAFHRASKLVWDGVYPT